MADPDAWKLRSYSEKMTPLSFVVKALLIERAYPSSWHAKQH